ncbi:basic secretory protein-like protein [Dinghuibacter silviterrae]|uniref:Basic secretory peptidase family protein n=1 Tax=Dinghuibacter silviterrae TaxID=1539049 RepID=A0A4R8DFH6_9BACT|nr:basic secretory protein-like protein [Dinghuibacter silviterrae]TDW96215.1 basic secretory peptidase family protein [Dinghuibacter silviterrae]
MTCFLALCLLVQVGVRAETRDTVTRSGYTLIFVNQDTAFDPAVKARLISTFFTVYPKEAALYNPQTLTRVTFVVDPSYNGVAETGGGVTRFNPQWFKKHPGDVDVVTHEVMHIVQAYPNGAGPGWITEGIADYVRYTLGVDNAGANWHLPDYAPQQSYRNAYRVTARFFAWLEAHGYAGVIKKLDGIMRTATYTDGTWIQLTGKDVDQLWADYAANPAL